MKYYKLMAGVYGDDGCCVFNFKYKKNAIAYIRKDKGYKLNKEYDLYENELEAQWYRIDKSEFIMEDFDI